jgi:hypothetical protein
MGDIALRGQGIEHVLLQKEEVQLLLGNVKKVNLNLVD